MSKILTLTVRWLIIFFSLTSMRGVNRQKKMSSKTQIKMHVLLLSSLLFLLLLELFRFRNLKSSFTFIWKYCGSVSRILVVWHVPGENDALRFVLSEIKNIWQTLIYSRLSMFLFQHVHDGEEIVACLTISLDSLYWV